MGNEDFWKIIPEKSKDHWLELEDPDGWYDAIAKWDGCVHFSRYYNTPKSRVEIKQDEEFDYIHICGGTKGIDDLIARLHALKRIASTYYNAQGRSHDGWEPEIVNATDPFLLMESTLNDQPTDTRDNDHAAKE